MLSLLKYREMVIIVFASPSYDWNLLCTVFIKFSLYCCMSSLNIGTQYLAKYSPSTQLPCSLHLPISHFEKTIQQTALALCHLMHKICILNLIVLSSRCHLEQLQLWYSHPLAISPKYRSVQSSSSTRHWAK